MNKKKLLFIIIILLVILSSITAIAINNESNAENALMKKFLKKYYSIAEITTETNLSEAYVKDEMSKYSIYMDEACIDEFVRNHNILVNKSYSRSNECTFSVMNIDIQNNGNSDDDFNLYQFNVTLKVVYKDKTEKEATAMGQIAIKHINGKPAITYFYCSKLTNQLKR